MNRVSGLNMQKQELPDKKGIKMGQSGFLKEILCEITTYLTFSPCEQEQ